MILPTSQGLHTGSGGPTAPDERSTPGGVYAQVTLAISDDCPGGLEGFAPLSERLPVSVFAAAIEDGQTMGESGASYSVFVDLMDGDDMQAGEKCIGLAQAALILELPPESLVPLGRQRLAQINDEDAERSSLSGDPWSR